ncbi:hypothetical protein PRIPAC_72826 [Pristionchus pacificus]|uniref:Uncharacterized protein n=1 Tax=Pristionchus pacificus TaxID=54126 RepID=A0A2A6C7P9_PRIPA|nr:hypothetical protein PRIPAC_72826 [Pristionchus pacificus]|eukprot:PDM74061.1 hypothetical protein PRIPAC_41417 [Pristionchus pacificus]
MVSSVVTPSVTRAGTAERSSQKETCELVHSWNTVAYGPLITLHKTPNEYSNSNEIYLFLIGRHFYENKLTDLVRTSSSLKLGRDEFRPSFCCTGLRLFQ